MNRLWDPIGQPKGVISPILPFRVRMKLLWDDKINSVGLWLVDHGHIEAAKRLWGIR